MLTQVGQESLRDIPELEPVRKQLFEDALHMYRQMQEEQGATPAKSNESRSSS